MIFTFQQEALNTFSMVNHDKVENMPETKTDNIQIALVTGASEGIGKA